MLPNQFVGVYKCLSILEVLDYLRDRMGGFWIRQDAEVADASVEDDAVEGMTDGQ